MFFLLRARSLGQALFFLIAQVSRSLWKIFLFWCNCLFLFFVYWVCLHLQTKLYANHVLYVITKVEQLWNFNLPTSMREMALFWIKKKKNCANHHVINSLWLQIWWPPTWSHDWKTFGDNNHGTFQKPCKFQISPLLFLKWRN